MKKRALVIGIGGLRGAYDAGAAAELCRELGADYFDAIYAASAGTYSGTLYATGQSDHLEYLWRNCLDGRKLVDFSSPLRGRPIFHLEYLTSLLLHEETSLDTETLSRVGMRLMYVITEQRTGKALYISPTSENVFALLNASCSMPFLHRPVIIKGTAYMDGGLSDPLPFAKALADGYDEVVVVYNKPKGFLVGSRYNASSHLLAVCLPKQIADLIKTLKFRVQDIEWALDREPRLKIIRPKVQLPLKSILDSDKARLNACVDMGIADAKEFLKTYKPT